MWQYNEWVGKKTNYDDLIQPPYQVSAFLSGMSFSALRIICDVWYILIKEGEVSPCVKIFISSARPPSVSVSANMCMAPRLKRVGQKTSTAAPDSCVKFYADLLQNRNLNWISLNKWCCWAASGVRMNTRECRETWINIFRCYPHAH